jgi:hypothetical protein
MGKTRPLSIDPSALSALVCSHIRQAEELRAGGLSPVPLARRVALRPLSEHLSK